MIIFDQEKLNQLLRAMSSGFRQDPRQLALFSVIVVVFIGVLVFFALYQSKRSRTRRLQEIQERFDNLLQKHRLTTMEMDILERMSGYLKKESEKLMLLEHEHTFDTAAEKLRKHGGVPDQLIAALRVKLGFRIESMEKIPHSSTELPVGMPVVVGQKGRKNTGGRILKQEPYSLVVEMDPGRPPPEKGMPIHLYFSNLSGLFGFSTVLLGSKGGIIKLRHSENVKRIQRREFYRKKIKLPVYVKPAGSEERPAASVFADLGGGGASLLNPSSRYKSGDKLFLTFFPTHDEEVNLIAKVVRLSGRGRIMHIEFLSVSDSSRDHILGLLFKSAE
jgi:hypothetical protein